MNRYPVWKYAIIVIAMVVGFIYTLPNFFGEAPAVQVSAGKATVKVDSTTLTRIDQALKAAGKPYQHLEIPEVGHRNWKPEIQLKILQTAADFIGRAFA